MDKPWHFFWFTLASVTVCAVISAIIGRGATPINLGSLADWFSGSMAAFAAGTALYIANRDAKRASDLRTEVKADELAAARLSDLRRMKVVMGVLANGIIAADHIQQQIREGKNAARWATSFIDGGNAQATADALAEVSVDSFVDVNLGLTLINVRQLWALEVAKFKAVAGGEPPAMQHMNTNVLEEASARIADLIVFRGGEATPWDGIQVQKLISEAAKRQAGSRTAAHAAAA